ncbi:MAG: CZB domain-containing protein [Campylobacter sp.]
MNVSNGKIDHINLKLSGYKAALRDEIENISDVHHCRFGKWFSEKVKNILITDQKDIQEISHHHENVHNGLIKAINIFSDKTQNQENGFNIMKDVENSSKFGFEKLLEAIKSARK